MARILIVDDNELNLELARDILEMEGFAVRTASSGEDGLREARSWHPDLILMDLRMPGMSGLAAMEAIKADPETAAIPVAALTASAMKGDRERLLEKGFDAYLEKPIDPGTFADQVRTLLQGGTAGD